MEDNILFPAFDAPDIIEDSQQYEKDYKKSILWNWETQDFVRDGANRLVYCDGLEAYKTWCFKIARTERFACLAYPDEIGVEMEEALQENSNKAVESAVERTLTESLLTNPCTEYVRDFSFLWEGDNLVCRCRIKGLEWAEFPLTVPIITTEVN